MTTTYFEEEEKAECRLCGIITPVSNIRKRMMDKIKGFVSFKEFVEYFCRIQLIENEDELNLPQGVCAQCYTTLLNFCVFSVNCEKNENNRLPKNAVNVRRGQEEDAIDNAAKRQRVNSSPNPDSGINSINTTCGSDDTSPSRRSKRSKNGENKTSPNDDEATTSSCAVDLDSRSSGGGGGSGIIKNTPSTHTIGKCFNAVLQLFNDEIAEREKSYEKITIKERLLLDGGEIPKEWLARYSNFVTWQDLPHKCDHCKSTFKSFGALLKHFQDVNLAFSKRSIMCSKCDAVFKSHAHISSYVNHIDRNHYNHLKFGCLFCDKIFCNVVKLCEHGIKEHGHLQYKFYPCLDCGLVCSTTQSLIQHKNCHEI